ncbi:MAG: hypothetical protein HDQ88_00110, partial [Clostridia bacterium]|nr:hypothetical protein [Clostridia bacterium]
MEETKLLPLYPKNSADYNSEAELLLNCVADDNVKNIGIVAQYGAGKSSFLKTFQETYVPEKNDTAKELKLKYLNISLARFNSEESNEDDEISSNIDNALEKSILQQMLYKKEKKDLPHSHIKRINNFVAGKFWSLFFLIISAAICCSAFALFGFNFTGTQIFDFPFCQIVYPVVGGLAFLVFAILIVKTISISKISVYDIEIDFSDKAESLLNKFLDEVIYFFQRTKYNVVIFEDLDRFNNLSIFTKLRELNNILNANEKVKANCGKITFLYATRNEIFKNATNRVKFFDIILTISPILSTLNVRDKILEGLKESNLGENWLPKSFIHDISFYIKDMRLLNCIINDCVAFTNEGGLKQIAGDEETYKHVQLFSLMAYKNFCPKEFAQFEREEGELTKLINYATTLLNQEIANVDKEIDRNTSSIASYNGKTTLTASEQEGLNTLKKKSNELYDKKSRYSGAISYIKANNKTVFQSVTVSTILKMIIENGYINDNFKEYLFRKGKTFMSKNVEKYCLIVLNREDPQFDLKLDNIGLIDLSADKFKVDSILNFDMVNYIFENSEANTDRFDSLKLLLNSTDKIIGDFLIAYIRSQDSYSKKFIKYIVEEKTDLFKLITESDLVSEKIVSFLEFVLLNCSEAEINRQIELDIFKSYLQGNEEFIKQIYTFKDKLTFLKAHGIIIENLADFGFTKEDLKEIDRSNIWSINYKNVVYLLTNLYDYEEEKIKLGGNTLIKDLESKDTSAYILADIGYYVSEIMLNTEKLELKDADFRELINDEKISLPTRTEIIKKQSNRMTYPATLPSENVMGCLLENNKIGIPASNISGLLRTYPNLSNKIAYYISLNADFYKENLSFNKEISLCLANSDTRINGQLLVEFFIEQVKTALPEVTKITNDETLAIILRETTTLSKNDITYISQEMFVKAPIVLIKKFDMLDIFQKNLANKRLIYLCIQNKVDLEVRAHIYKEEDVCLEEYDFGFAQTVYNDICTNKFCVSDNLYDSLTKFKLDKKPLFLSQIEYMSKDKIIDRLKTVEPKFCKLV